VNCYFPFTCVIGLVNVPCITDPYSVSLGEGGIVTGVLLDSVRNILLEIYFTTTV